MTGEQLGRERKAFGIALHLWRLVPREDRTRSDLGERLMQMPQEHRDAVAHRAGKRTPSELTWKRVCEMIDEKAAEERRFQGMLDDHRAVS